MVLKKQVNPLAHKVELKGNYRLTLKREPGIYQQQHLEMLFSLSQEEEEEEERRRSKKERGMEENDFGK